MTPLVFFEFIATLVKWGKLHAVRSALSFVASTVYVGLAIAS